MSWQRAEYTDSLMCGLLGGALYHVFAEHVWHDALGGFLSVALLAGLWAGIKLGRRAAAGRRR